MQSWIQRLFRWFGGLFSRPTAALLLPASRPRVGFGALMAAAVKDPQADGWIAQLRTEAVFPQARFGASDPPHSAQEYLERVKTLEEQIIGSLARGASDPSGGSAGLEPEWFLLLADRLFPLAAWFVGVGLGVESPELLQRAERAVAKVMDTQAEKIKDNLGSLVDRVDRLISHKSPSPSERPPPKSTQASAVASKNPSSAMSAHMTQMRLHFELLLRPFGAEVSFEFPSVGQRIAELVPPPAHGSPTSGVVARVLCPAITVTVPSEPPTPQLTYTRGAHVRA